jgi:hypothetical protein
MPFYFVALGAYYVLNVKNTDLDLTLKNLDSGGNIFRARFYYSPRATLASELSQIPHLGKNNENVKHIIFYKR